MVKALIFVVTFLMGQSYPAPIIHDFGITVRNQELGHIFKLKNESKGLLIIEGIESG